EQGHDGEHAAPGVAEQLYPHEPELRSNGVYLIAKDGDRPLEVLRAVRAPAAELVVEDDRALFCEPLERAEVVVRRPRSAVESKQRRCRSIEIADDAVPRAVAEIVDVALRSRHWVEYVPKRCCPDEDGR